jgi:opacity protein-like surface antigen
MIRCRFSSVRNWKTKVLFTALCCTMLPISAFAEGEVAPTIGVGSKAILFSFNGLAILGAGAFNGGIGGKYYLMENLAARGGLQFLTVSRSIPANPPVGITGTDGSQSAFQLGLNAAVEYHLSKSRVSPYVGGGFLFLTTTTNNKTAVQGALASVETQNAANGETIDGVPYYAGLNFGLMALGGIEFFITNEISLGAEYQLGYNLNSRYNQKIVNGLETKVGNTNTIGIKATGLLTLAVYF